MSDTVTGDSVAGDSGGGEAGAERRLLAAARLLGGRARASAPLGALTTYRVGGTAALMVDARSAEDLAGVAHAASSTGLPVLVVGRGSNLLVADRGFAGIAVTLDPGAFGSVCVDGTEVTAGAAVPLPALARRTADAGLSGFEWAVGVPGSLGGAVRMNAGGHGSDMAACLVRCQVADLADGGRIREIDAADLGLGYRRSVLGPGEVVVSARLRLASGDAATGRETIRDIVRWRREHQPGGQNAGSVFVNPSREPGGRSAGWLVDAAGLKGHRVGTATVSAKHANFIQADAEGSADDVARLIGLVIDVVAARFGMRMRPEVRMVGFPLNLQPVLEGEIELDG